MNESELALGLIECINKMGNTHNSIYTDGDIRIINNEHLKNIVLRTI